MFRDDYERLRSAASALSNERDCFFFSAAAELLVPLIAHLTRKVSIQFASTAGFNVDQTTAVLSIDEHANFAFDLRAAFLSPDAPTPRTIPHHVRWADFSRTDLFIDIRVVYAAALPLVPLISDGAGGAGAPAIFSQAGARSRGPILAADAGSLPLTTFLS